MCNMQVFFNVKASVTFFYTESSSCVTLYGIQITYYGQSNTVILSSTAMCFGSTYHQQAIRIFLTNMYSCSMLVLVLTNNAYCKCTYVFKHFLWFVEPKYVLVVLDDEY